MKNSVKRYSLAGQVADDLEEKIVSGEYAVGAKIPPESELMQIFGVSRNTVREAVKSLASAGVLEVRQGDGTYVRSNDRFRANMDREYRKVSLLDIREARNALEGAIAQLAARRRTQEDLEKIEAALHKWESCCDIEGENTKADLEFHLAVTEACHNKILIDLYNSLLSYLTDQIAVRQQTTMLTAVEIDRMHKYLLLTIQRQDEEGARRCCEKILEI